jgi:hypothetical protein
MILTAFLDSYVLVEKGWQNEAVFPRSGEKAKCLVGFLTFLTFPH